MKWSETGVLDVKQDSSRFMDTPVGCRAWKWLPKIISCILCGQWHIAAKGLNMIWPINETGGHTVVIGILTCG